MPLFGRGPKMEDVRKQLIGLLQQQPGTPPENLVAPASRILTSDVARKAEGKVSECQILAGDEAVSVLPPNDVDRYLRLVLAVAESSLGQRSNVIRFNVSSAGSNFHQQRAGVHCQTDRWNEAETEFRKALGYENLSPSAGIVVNTANVAIAVWNQGRQSEARILAQEAVNAFSRLGTGDVSYASAQHAAGLARKFLS